MFTLSSCLKEGQTGLGTIEGYIQTDLYSKTTGTFLTSYIAQEERVYIVYGDNDFYNDDTRTSFNGKFEFPFLNKGDYTIFVYSECFFNLNTCPSGSEVYTFPVTLDARNATASLDTIIVKLYD